MLLGRTSKKSSIPPLQRDDKTWVHDSVERANMFGTTFESKSALPEWKSDPDLEHNGSFQSAFLLLRHTVTRAILRAIDADGATGPDGVPGRILKECAEVLAAPVTLLVKMMLLQGEWPDIWREHWVVPLYKKKSVWKAVNYRGVHLTAVMSKTAERILATLLTSYFEASGAYGKTQWGFRKRRSCRDLVAMLTAKWILSFHRGKRVGVYLSDISGAFDRVSTPLLLRKLQKKGVAADLLRLLESYLQTRKSVVLVEGKQSRGFKLENTIFQGTVLGPPLWNTFFSDVTTAIPESFDEEKFADDLTVFREFDESMQDGDGQIVTLDNNEICKILKTCQASVHSWGEENQVLFDAGKEAFEILEWRPAVNKSFRVLGTIFDSALNMEDEISARVGKAKPKVTAILRCRQYYDKEDLVKQFKTHVWCILEGNVGGFYHACDTILGRLDQVQESFERALDFAPGEAFFAYNLIPLTTRRDIAMLGFIFRCAKGLAPEAGHPPRPIEKIGVRPGQDLESLASGGGDGEEYRKVPIWLDRHG